MNIITISSGPDNARVTVEVHIPETSLSDSDLNAARQHHDDVHRYLREGETHDNVERIVAWQHRGITDKRTETFIPFEYDTTRLEFWYLSEISVTFSAEEFYREPESY